jgi:hypothetical protein
MFVKIGSDRVINLNNVAQMFERVFDMRPCIQIDFTGPDGLYERFYPDSAEYAALRAWMQEQTYIKQSSDVLTRIAVAIELLERR